MRLIETALIYSKVAELEKRASMQAQSNRSAIEDLKQEQQKSAQYLKQQKEIAQQHLLDSRRERQTRQLVFELRKRVGQWVRMQNPFHAFVEAKEIAAALKNVSVAFLPDMASKQFHEDTCRAFPVLLKQVEERFGSDTFNHIKAFCHCIDSVGDIAFKVDTGRNAALAVAPTVPERLTILEQKLEQTMAMARQIPRADEVRYGVWPKCREYLEGIVRPGWRNWFLLKCAALVVKSDGRIEADERKAFIRLATLVALTDEEAEHLLMDTRSISKVEMERANIRSDELLPILIGIAASDGQLATAEKRMLEKISSCLGIPKTKLDSMITSTLAAHPVWTLDVNEALRRIPHVVQVEPSGVLGRLAKAAKDKMRAYRRADELTAEALDSLRKSLRIPEERTILLVYELANEQAALTDRHLHFNSRAFGGKVPLQEVGEMEVGILSCKFRAADRTVTLSVAAQEFLKLVQKIINECLKRVSG